MGALVLGANEVDEVKVCNSLEGFKLQSVQVLKVWNSGALSMLTLKLLVLLIICNLY